MNSIYEKLTGLPIFKGVTRAFIHTFAEKTPLSFSKFGPGDKVARASETCRSVLCLLSGRVMARRRVWGGELAISEILEAETIIGCDRLFGLDNKFGVDYSAMDVCGTMEFPKRIFVLLLQENQVVMVNYMNLLSRICQQSTESVRDNSGGNALHRLRALLMQATVRDSKGIVLESASAPLAAVLDLEADGLLGRLESAGLVAVESDRRLRVLSRQGILDSTAAG